MRKNKLNTKEVIEQFKNIHGNKYTYDKIYRIVKSKIILDKVKI